MKLSKDYRYTILCEDVQTRNFLQSFLFDQGISVGKISCNMAPAGDGCGSQYVRKYYSSEVKTLLCKNFQRLVLFVSMDADNHTLEERKQELQKQLLSDFSNDKRNTNLDITKECIILWFPKKQIENWIHFLRGEDTNEDVDYPHGGNKRKAERCSNEAKQLSKYFQDLELYEKGVLPSIELAKTEYKRVCQLQIMK